jgi:two-component system sensor histidine kinase UhpB
MAYFKFAAPSLRIRLIVIPASLLVIGIFAATITTLYGARDRIHSETESGVNLGSRLIEYALNDIAEAPHPDEVLRQLREDVAHVRHIKVAYLADPSQAPVEPPDSDANRAAPEWFQQWFEPARLVQTFMVRFDGGLHGKLLMWTQPADEVNEVWLGLTFVTGLLGLLAIAMIALILLTARQTLAPLHTLVEGLDRLEHGQFDALAEIRVVELRRIGETFNRLARSLSRTEADNHFLIDRLMSVQESERKELARELHDEFGASLFGIRAAASCIVAAADSRDAQDDATTKDIIDRAKLISTLADGIQKQNYRILDRIRPVILNQMGLFDALRHLVDSWAAQHRDCTYELSLPAISGGFDEDVSLTSYRIIQECLTNVARHSKASAMHIALHYISDPDASRLQILVEDDGIGLPPGFRFGFGFLGMSERLRKLGGQLLIRNGAISGIIIEASMPAPLSPLAHMNPPRLENVLAKG